MLSGIGPRAELEAVGVACTLDPPDVGKHLKDHLQVGLMFPAPGIGVSMNDVGISMGPDALRAPNGPLPADPADDSSLPPELQALKADAERRVTEWATTGHGLVSSSLYDAAAWFSTGLGDDHTHDAQLAVFVTGYNRDVWQRCFRVDPDEYFDDADATLAPDAESIFVLANPVQPHSEGEIRLASTDPLAHPDIRMNYYDDPYDLEVMIAVLRRGARHRRALAGRARSPARTEAARGQARLQARRPPERRAPRRHGAPLLLHRVPPHQHLPHR